MKRLLFVIILLFFIITSCSKSKPSGILSESKMAELMTEVHVLDSYLNTLPMDSSRRALPALYKGVLSKYDLDSIGFIANLDYYNGNPIEMDRVYKEVKTSLTGYQREAFVSDSLTQKHVRDSLHRASVWQTELMEQRNLILNVHKDSTRYTYYVDGMRFFQKLPIQFYRHPLLIIPSITNDEPVSKSEPTADKELKPLTDSISSELSSPVKDTVRGPAIRKRLENKKRIISGQIKEGVR